MNYVYKCVVSSVLVCNGATDVRVHQAICRSIADGYLGSHFPIGHAGAVGYAGDIDLISIGLFLDSYCDCLCFVAVGAEHVQL